MAKGYRDALAAALERANALRVENDLLRDQLRNHPPRDGHFGLVGWSLVMLIALCVGALVVIANPT